jgi:hypothetical protein
MVDGLRMVAVDVAIAHRGPETLRDRRGSESDRASVWGLMVDGRERLDRVRWARSAVPKYVARWSWSEADRASGCAGRWSMVDGRERSDGVRWAHSAEREIARAAPPDN